MPDQENLPDAPMPPLSAKTQAEMALGRKAVELATAKLKVREEAEALAAKIDGAAEAPTEVAIRSPKAKKDKKD